MEAVWGLMGSIEGCIRASGGYMGAIWGLVGSIEGCMGASGGCIGAYGVY